ncbi:ferredoxin family protein [Rhodococcus opacus]|nr:ferredoxin family protein [Rhodococcus opacus]
MIAQLRRIGAPSAVPRIWISTPLNAAVRINSACVDHLVKACNEECPVDCIHEGNRVMHIYPDECVDCAACEPVCPVEAIYPAEDVPTQ